jgi:hypothetical protein
MSKFLDNIEAEIKNIHHAHSVDNEAATQAITEAVILGVAPLRGQVTLLQEQVADLQKAAQDTVAALQSGDTATALTTATAAAGSNNPPAGGESAGSEGDGQAVS